MPEATFRRLPALFADALPDDFGNALIDAWMAEHGTTRAEITTLARLAYMGKRGMGALEFKPALGSHRESAVPLQIKALWRVLGKTRRMVRKSYSPGNSFRFLGLRSRRFRYTLVSMLFRHQRTQHNCCCTCCAYVSSGTGRLAI